ncbi:hypothetical protein Tco_0499249 [Tanacetum coccineum]
MHHHLTTDLPPSRPPHLVTTVITTQPPWLPPTASKTLLRTSKTFYFLPRASAAKPPSWWRSDDGTATTAAPYGVGLWRRNPSGCLAVLSRLTSPLWRLPSRLWPPQPPRPHHGICLLAWMGWNADIEGRGLGELCTYDKMFSFKET